MPEAGSTPIDVVIVLHQSARVVEAALESLEHAAPRRGVRVLVVDNASTDDGLAIAIRCSPGIEPIRQERNSGFAGGVNAGLARTRSEFVVLMNPDLRFAPHALDLLADHLEVTPLASLVGPRVDLADGHREPTAGVFPTLAREFAHALFLDRFLGLPGRRRPQPEIAEAVEWVSGCAWMLRMDRSGALSTLDEGYFMYVEDVDFCRRLRDAGREVWVEPSAVAQHARGTGSSSSSQLPADGGRSLLRYFQKHTSAREVALARSVLRIGWWLRAGLHRVLSGLGRPQAASLAARYSLALKELSD